MSDILHIIYVVITATVSCLVISGLYIFLTIEDIKTIKVNNLRTMGANCIFTPDRNGTETVYSIYFLKMYHSQMDYLCKRVNIILLVINLALGLYLTLSNLILQIFVHASKK